MTEKKVAILMSTYNGERFLDDQIQSIIKQTYDNFELYIRDDGSKDSTQKIIQKYSDANDNIHFFNGGHVKNVGVVRSFMSLLKGTDADYYMFSDQDDYWKPTKVEHTISVMEAEKDQDQPVCVHTDLQIVDSSLHGNEVMNGDDVWHNFNNLLFCNCVTGCTMMINQALKDKADLDNLDLNHVYMHDWWLALIASYFGKLIYLNEPTILYRQHGDNVVGSMAKNTIPHLIHRVFDQKIDEENLLNVFETANLFDYMYGDEMQGLEKKYVETYGNLIPHSSLKNNFVTFIKLPPQRNHLKGKIFFSYLMLQDYRKIKCLSIKK